MRISDWSSDVCSSDLWWPADEDAHPLLATMGPEPFDPAFNGDYLFRKSRGRVVAVKNFIMDGHIVVGAGNIYAAESLFRAGIRPTRRTGTLTRADCARLADRIREVLAEAVERGGPPLRAFFGADGASGRSAARTGGQGGCSTWK